MIAPKHWIADVLDFVRKEQDKDGTDDGYTLEGADLGWEQWLKVYFPHVASKPLAQRHRRLWHHIDSLRPGTKPAPYVALWCRGGGKSTSIELGAARLCVTMQRRFCLYLSGTQDQANKHVQAVQSLLESERIGVQRLENPYGYSKGWQKNILRTANGFNVAGVGAEVALRGIKFDHFRPDIIFIDDIDQSDNSPEAVTKLINLITRAILPAGSPDCAVVFVQNLVDNGSIASKLLNRTANFLVGATVDGPYPAVEGLAYEKHPDTVDPQTGEVEEGRYYITAGTPTWAGQNLATCEDQINEWGPDAFEIEAQHNLSLARTFFPQYDKEQHLVHPVFTYQNQPPHWYQFFGGIDWGFSDPYAWVLCCLDENGEVHVIEGYERATLTNPEQARRICDALDRWGIDKKKCTFTYDPSMDNEKTYDGKKADADIKAYIDAGLTCAPADRRADSTKHGWGRLRNLLKGAEGRNIRFWRGPATRVAEAVQEAKPDKNRREELRHDANSHLCHALLYAVVGRFGIAEPPRSAEEIRQENYGKHVLQLAEYRQRGKVRGKDYL